MHFKDGPISDMHAKYYLMSEAFARIRVVSVLFPFGQVVSARVVSARFLG